MSPERWRRIEDVYHAAREQVPGRQQGFLAEACTGDEDLRREVESLLAQENISGPVDRPPRVEQLFTSRSATLAAAGVPLSGGMPAAGIMGRYRILRVAGQGGMGTVYEVEQNQPRRIVALKIIRPGLTGHELMRRFELESQALGRLQHPGIAQIYEAGTTDSGSGPQPYFAMEFIRGDDLRTYAERNRLNTRQRLELMIKICEAVEHAHQHGIIHRDLKPANILVDETGQPKILDFGVARLTDSDTQVTRQTDVGQLVGTLAYMSPEQVLADPLGVDTRSDVYSLGVVLFELLSGQMPYTLSRKLHEAVQAIREDDPTSLSSINRDYRGDIETIVARALEKDKSRRYPSAAALAADIQRHLRDEPIAARPASAFYQLHKFARRHRALVAGFISVFAALLAGVVVSTRQAVRARTAEQAAVQQRDRASTAEHNATVERDRARSAEGLAQQQRDAAVRERQRADTEAATATAVTDFLQGDLLGQAGASGQLNAGIHPDPDLKVRAALDRAARKISGQFDRQPLVEASVRYSMGRAYQDLGIYPEAQKHFERAIELRRKSLGADDPETLRCMSDLADVYRSAGKYNQAVSLFQKTLDGQKRVLGERHPDTLESMNNLAVVYHAKSEHQSAELLFRRVLSLREQVLGKEAPATLQTMNNLAFLCETTGKYSEAEKLYVKALDILGRVRGENHLDTLDTLNNLASLYFQQAKYPQAESIFIKLLEARRQVQGEEHPATVEALNNLAQAYRSEGQNAKAEAIQLRVVALMQRLRGEMHPDTLTSVNNLAIIYREEGKYADSEDLFKTTLAARQRVLGAEHRDTLVSMSALAMLYDKEGRYSEAEALILQTYELRRRLLGEDHPETLRTLNTLAGEYFRQGEFAKAEPVFAHLVAARRRVSGADHPETLLLMQNLSVAYRSQCKFAAAETLVKQVLDARKRLLGDQDPDTLRTMYSLGVLYRYLGKYTNAEPLLITALEGQTRALGAEHLFTLATMNELGENYRAQANRARAEGLFAQVLEARRRVQPPAHPDTTSAMVALGRVRLEQEKFDEAAPLLREALDRYESTTPETWVRFEAQCLLGASLAGQADYAGAEALLLPGYEKLSKWRAAIPVDGERVLPQSAEWIIRMYEKWGKAEKAAEWRARMADAPVRKACSGI